MTALLPSIKIAPPEYVVFDDVIIVKEATTINTKQFSNAFINDYVVNKPKKIILRCYPVIPTAGRTNMRMGDSIWNSSGYVDQYIADHRFSGAKTGNLGDGTEMAFESICNFVEGTENDFDCVTEFNTGGTITKRISFSPTQDKHFRASFQYAVGEGSRFLVILEY